MKSYFSFIKSSVFVVLASFLFAFCAKEVLDEGGEYDYTKTYVDISAVSAETYSDGNKTHLAYRRDVRWSEGDKISAFYSDDASSGIEESKNSVSSEEASDYTAHFIFPMPHKYTYAFYPSDQQNVSVSGSKVIFAEGIPGTQTLKSTELGNETFDEKTNLAVASCGTTKWKFANVGALVGVRVGYDGEDGVEIKGIRLSHSTGFLSGPVTVDCSNWTTESNGSTDIHRSVYLDCPEGYTIKHYVKTEEEDEFETKAPIFYFVVVPGKFENGEWTIEFIRKSDGKVATYHHKAALEIPRNNNVILCQLSIKESKFDPVKHVESVTLDKESCTLYTNIASEKTIDLTATVLPDDALDKRVTWESDNTDVATVDDEGTVTAFKAGTATITCTSVDNTDAYDQCTVTVKTVTPTTEDAAVVDKVLSPTINFSCSFSDNIKLAEVEYGVKYSTSSHAEDHNYDKTVKIGTASTASGSGSKEVENLNNFTTYYYSAYAKIGDVYTYGEEKSIYVDYQAQNAKTKKYYLYCVWSELDNKGAIADAQEGEEVDLLRDTYDEYGGGYLGIWFSNKKMTFDLNGHEVKKSLYMGLNGTGFWVTVKSTGGPGVIGGAILADPDQSVTFSGTVTLENLTAYFITTGGNNYVLNSGFQMPYETYKDETTGEDKDFRLSCTKAGTTTVKSGAKLSDVQLYSDAGKTTKLVCEHGSYYKYDPEIYPKYGPGSSVLQIEDGYHIEDGSGVTGYPYHLVEGAPTPHIKWTFGPDGVKEFYLDYPKAEWEEGWEADLMLDSYPAVKSGSSGSNYVEFQDHNGGSYYVTDLSQIPNVISRGNVVNVLNDWQWGWGEHDVMANIPDEGGSYGLFVNIDDWYSSVLADADPEYDYIYYHIEPNNEYRLVNSGNNWSQTWINPAEHWGTSLRFMNFTVGAKYVMIIYNHSGANANFKFLPVTSTKPQ